MSNIDEFAIILNTASSSSLSTIKDKADWLLIEQLNFKKAKKISIAIKRFSYVNWFQNIFVSDNVGFHNVLYYSDNPANDVKYSITIPVGSYTITSLSLMIAELLRENGHDDIFTLNGATSINKAYFTFNAAGWYINMSSSGPYTLLGFTVSTYLPADQISSINEISLATTKAKFNFVESIKVRTNLTWGVIDSINQSNLLAEIVPVTTIGSIHSFEPFNLTWSDSLALKSGISDIQIWLQDQNGSALSMSENWTVELVIHVYN